MIQRWGVGKVCYDVANLAHEQNLLSVLPHVLYTCCCSFSTTQIIDGFISNQDGTFAHLCPDNERRCLLAHRRILQLQADSTFAWCNWSEEDYPTCQSAVECSLARKNIIAEVFFDYVGYKMGLMLWEEQWEDNMCYECVEVCKKYHATGRLNFWRGLPDVFDLPPWEELVKERLVTAR